VCLHYIFFSQHTASPELYTLSLHDALPISAGDDKLLPHTDRVARKGVCLLQSIDAHTGLARDGVKRVAGGDRVSVAGQPAGGCRSEEHTSELQSRENLVCRLLLEKKKNKRR